MGKHHPLKSPQNGFISLSQVSDSWSQPDRMTGGRSRGSNILESLPLRQEPPITGWWFKTFRWFSIIYGIILPLDFHIFQRGRYTTNQITLEVSGGKLMGCLQRLLPRDAIDMGVSINGGTPIAGWFIMEHPINMDDLGVPISGRLHVTMAATRRNLALMHPPLCFYKWPGSIYYLAGAFKWGTLRSNHTTFACFTDSRPAKTRI